jgi:hypothetical protein
VVLKGGVTLDHGTSATIGTTAATNTYFQNTPNLNSADATFNGSLLSVIRGPNNTPTMLTMQDRMLGVYDGSTINLPSNDGSNKALLSVLDARLTGPASVPLIDIDAAFADDGKTQGHRPTVSVTSAVVTRSTIPLDGALLTASAPLLALTNATMTTASHFADLAGNKNQALLLNDALVAMRAATLTVGGNLLNLNNATATLNGYLFSLAGGSTLTLNGGSLFNLMNGSVLNLNANAFGVFGSGTNTLSITNTLCAASCGLLVNSANQPFLLNGTPLHVAGVTHNVMLPTSFSVFAAAPTATPHVSIGPNDALFKVDSTSTLMIHGIKVN